MDTIDKTFELDNLDRLARLLDSKYRIPGTPIRFGLDTLVGFVPVIGDIAVAAPSAYLIYKGYQMGARKRTIARMGVNAGLDWTIGSIPVVGDIFDLFFKANNRNVALLKSDLERHNAKHD